MSALSLLFWLVAAALAGGTAAWLYRRREVPVPGRGVLAALRVAALALLLLLLFDPALPGGTTSEDGRWVLLDASLSMAAGGGEGWQAALERARTLEGRGVRVALFGGGEPRPLEAGALAAAADTLRPSLAGSILEPSLVRAAEAGARRVHLVSDLRIEDAVAAAAAARRVGLEVVVEPVELPGPGAGVSRFDLPDRIRSGDSVAVSVELFASGPGPDSATLTVREEERPVASRRVALPDPGRVRTVDLVLSPPADSGTVRYVAAVEAPGDAFPGDDARPGYLPVDPLEGALVLVSTAPDWEPRFLLPVLGRVTGLPVLGFLRLGEDRWLETDGESAGRTVDDATVAEAVRGAELVVAQPGGPAPEWLAGSVEDAPRLAVLPRNAAGAALAGLDARAPVPGEWYVAPSVPASPLAGELSGVPDPGLPPLGPLIPLALEQDVTVALRVTTGGAGAGEPALVLREDAAGRTAAVLAPGLWRWAFRPGPAREAYEALWSGVAGWLLARETVAGGGRVRPVEPVVEAGRAPGWLVPGTGEGPDSVRITLSRGDTTVADTTLAVPPSGRVLTPALPTGSYAWEAVRTGAGSAGDGDGGDAGGGEDPGDADAAQAADTGPPGDARSAGRLDVAPAPGELRVQPAVDVLDVPAPEAEDRAGRGEGRPLRAHPLPYLVLLGLLSAEWIGRRRKGLR